MIEAEWWEYEDADEFAEAVAGDVGFIIESALDARGEALIAIAGGRTPFAAYQKLAAQKLKWKNVTIGPTDDRLVPVTADVQGEQLHRFGAAGPGAKCRQSANPRFRPWWTCPHRCATV